MIPLRLKCSIILNNSMKLIYLRGNREIDNIQIYIDQCISTEKVFFFGLWLTSSYIGDVLKPPSYTYMETILCLKLSSIHILLLLLLDNHIYITHLFNDVHSKVGKFPRFLFWNAPSSLLGFNTQLKIND